ncbi:hypothetical protein AAP_06427 [Ascosphaera apis ARSEF 7405]|uniref:Retrotransposon gag protein n=1 Tax=Ascosphaera apis ARSEF 7405 TaxID=392613 RepID=A0A162IBH1_9EURO|nr:hypothetical protein AAP_06427 [Ascosphaera apis ARSEF 7405]
MENYEFPPKVVELAQQLGRYHQDRQLYWERFPPQALAAIEALTGLRVYPPGVPGLPRAKPDTKSTRSGQPPDDSWPPLWGSGSTSDLNQAVSALYRATRSLEATQNYREIYTRLVTEGDFEAIPLGPRALRKEAPYLKEAADCLRLPGRRRSHDTASVLSSPPQLGGTPRDQPGASPGDAPERPPLPRTQSTPGDWPSPPGAPNRRRFRGRGARKTMSMPPPRPVKRRSQQRDSESPEDQQPERKRPSTAQSGEQAPDSPLQENPAGLHGGAYPPASPREDAPMMDAPPVSPPHAANPSPVGQMPITDLDRDPAAPPAHPGTPLIQPPAQWNNGLSLFPPAHQLHRRWSDYAVGKARSPVSSPLVQAAMSALRRRRAQDRRLARPPSRGTTLASPSLLELRLATGGARPAGSQTTRSAHIGVGTEPREKHIKLESSPVGYHQETTPAKRTLNYIPYTKSRIWWQETVPVPPKDTLPASLHQYALPYRPKPPPTRSVGVGTGHDLLTKTSTVSSDTTPTPGPRVPGEARRHGLDPALEDRRRPSVTLPGSEPGNTAPVPPAPADEVNAGDHYPRMSRREQARARDLRGDSTIEEISARLADQIRTGQARTLDLCDRIAGRLDRLERDSRAYAPPAQESRGSYPAAPFGQFTRLGADEPDWGPPRTEPPTTPYRPGDQRAPPDPAGLFRPQTPWSGPRATPGYPSRVSLGHGGTAIPRRRAAFRPEVPDPYELKKWDPKDVGIFYPDMPNSYGQGNPAFYRGGRYFREVTGFTRNIRDYTRRHPASPLYSKLETLLQGDAFEWYTQTLTDEVRDDFYHSPDGVEQFLLALESKFRLNPLRAQQHLTAITFGPQQVRENRTSDRYLSEIRNALTAAGVSTSEEAVVQRAWMQLDPAYRDRVPPPRPQTSITEFTEMLDSYRVAWEDATEDRPASRTPHRVRFAARSPSVANNAWASSSPEASRSPSPSGGSAYAATGGNADDRLSTLERMLERLTAAVEKAFADSEVRPSTPRRASPGPARGPNRDSRYTPRQDETRARYRSGAGDPARPNRRDSGGGDFYQRRNQQVDASLKPEGSAQFGAGEPGASPEPAEEREFDEGAPEE